MPFFAGQPNEVWAGATAPTRRVRGRFGRVSNVQLRPVNVGRRWWECLLRPAVWEWLPLERDRSHSSGCAVSRGPHHRVQMPVCGLRATWMWVAEWLPKYLSSRDAVPRGLTVPGRRDGCFGLDKMYAGFALLRTHLGGSSACAHHAVVAQANHRRVQQQQQRHRLAWAAAAP
jgi:hypothetical protein